MIDDMYRTVNVFLVESFLLCKDKTMSTAPARRSNSPVQFNPDLDMFNGAHRENKANPPLLVSG